MQSEWPGESEGASLPSIRTRLAKAQVRGDRPTATISEGGKMADDDIRSRDPYRHVLWLEHSISATDRPVLSASYRTGCLGCSRSPNSRGCSAAFSGRRYSMLAWSVAHRSCGLCQSRVLRGRWLSSSPTRARSAAVWTRRLVPFGNVLVAGPLVVKHGAPEREDVLGDVGVDRELHDLYSSGVGLDAGRLGGIRDLPRELGVSETPFANEPVRKRNPPILTSRQSPTPSACFDRRSRRVYGS